MHVCKVGCLLAVAGWGLGSCLPVRADIGLDLPVSQPFCPPQLSSAGQELLQSPPSLRLAASESVSLAEWRDRTRQSLRERGLSLPGKIAPAPLPDAEPETHLYKETEQSPAETVQPETLFYPLPSRVAISSGFGLREHPISGHLDFHQGIDLPAAAGTPILAAFSGRAISVGATGDLGIAVVLEHDDNRRTRYGHMLIAAVSPNAWVNRGDTIGFVGSTGNSTGPHLHFEYWEQQSDLTWVVLDMEDRLAMADIGVDALAASPLPQPDTTPLAAGGAEHRVEIELDCLDLTLR